MQLEKTIFNHGRLHFELIEALGTYRQLQNFSDDQDALRAHLNGKGRPKKISEEGGIEDLEDKDIERFIEPVAESIDTAIANYRRQLLGNLCINPQRMCLHMRAGCGSIPAYAAI